MAKPVDPQIRAAVLTELLAGGSVNDVAKRHGVGRVTVRRWRDAAGLSTPVLQPDAQANVSQALDRHICKILATLDRQLDRAGDLDWFSDPEGTDAFIKLWHTLQNGAARIVAAQQVEAVEDEQPTPLRRAV